MRPAAALLLVLAGMAVAPAGALAHAGLVDAEPAIGARLGASPEAVRLTFSEQPEASLSEVRVLGPEGAPEQVGGVRTERGDPSTLEVRVRKLPTGVYTVDWKAISAVDGHATDGSFSFGVRASPSGPGASEGSATAQSSGLELVARWVFLLGLVALLGAGVATLARFGGGRGDLALAASGWALAVVGLLLLAEAERADAGTSFGGLLGSSVGEALIWRAVGLGAAAVALLVAWRRPRARRAGLALASAAALGTVVAHVTAGHADAGGWSTAISVSAQVAHFAAAGIWLGGLAALLLGFRGATAAERVAAVRRFAPIALVAIVVLLATGVLRAIDELGSWGGLLDSGYGRAVLAKALLLATIVAIAARNRPRPGGRGGGDLAGVRRRSRIELGLGVAAVGLAALLGTFAPPGTTQPVPAGLSASGHDFGTTVRVELTAASNQPGPNLFAARISDYDSGAPIAGGRVSLRFTPLDEPAALPSTLALRRAADGTYVGSGANVAFDGRWGVEAVIERGGNAVEVPLELDFPVPEQFVSVLDIPGSPRPPQYTMETENGFLRMTPDPDRPGANRIYVQTFSQFENSIAADQLVVTLASPGRPTTQLPVRRLGPARFVASADLPAGPVEIGVFARTREGARERGIFKAKVSSE